MMMIWRSVMEMELETYDLWCSDVFDLFVKW
jgi:hypothetical protein